MSPHQRAFSWPASAVKSRRIRSARAAAAGSGIVVLRHRAGDPGRAHQPGDALRAVPAAPAGQLAMDARRAVAAPGLLVHLPDPPGELSVPLLAAVQPGPVRREGGAGDLQQRARPLDVAPASPLRLDERVDVHRVSVTKKAVAPLEDLHVPARPASPTCAPRSQSGRSPARPGLSADHFS
jgi:hypothetical protein